LHYLFCSATEGIETLGPLRSGQWQVQGSGAQLSKSSVNTTWPCDLVLVEAARLQIPIPARRHALTCILRPRKDHVAARELLFLPYGREINQSTLYQWVYTGTYCARYLFLSCGIIGTRQAGSSGFRGTGIPKRRPLHPATVTGNAESDSHGENDPTGGIATGLFALGFTRNEPPRGTQRHTRKNTPR
jgi:hypothetical protein